MFSTIISAIRLALGLSILSTLNMFHFVKNLYWTIYTQIWDVNLHLANIFTPELDPKRVIAQGKPGANGAPSISQPIFCLSKPTRIETLPKIFIILL
jgi:hypothetical protein